MALKRRKYRRAPRIAPPPWRPYAQQLRIAIRKLSALIHNRLLSRWGHFVSETSNLRQDSPAQEIPQILNGVRVEYERTIEPKVRDDVRNAVGKTVSRGRAGASRQTKALLGIDIGAEPYLTDFLGLFVESNVGLIKSVGETYLSQVGTIVTQGLLTGATQNEISEQLIERADVAESRAQFIARDQTAKLNSQITALRMGRAGIDKYEWSTSHDERVRDSHREKDGNIYSFDNPPADTGNPGEDYNCRCVAIPVMPEETADL